MASSTTPTRWSFYLLSNSRTIDVGQSLSILSCAKVKVVMMLISTPKSTKVFFMGKWFM